MVRDPTAQRRPDRRRGHNRHAVESEGCRPFSGWKGIYKDGLFHRSQSSAADSLQHAKKNQRAQAGGEAAQQGTDSEERHANHVVALAPEESAQPRGER